MKKVIWWAVGISIAGVLIACGEPCKRPGDTKHDKSGTYVCKKTQDGPQWQPR